MVWIAKYCSRAWNLQLVLKLAKVVFFFTFRIIQAIFNHSIKTGGSMSILNKCGVVYVTLNFAAGKYWKLRIHNWKIHAACFDAVANSLYNVPRSRILHELEYNLHS